MSDQQRTVKQNASLHLWLRMVADCLNDAGLDMKKTLQPSIDIPWTEETAKNHLWKPVQEAMTGNDSTAEATTTDYDKVCQTITRHLSERFEGLVIPPWPDRFGQMEAGQKIYGKGEAA